MTSTNDILKDICARPERDDFRLRYADAVEARDPEYARYIRSEIIRGEPHLDNYPSRVRDRIVQPVLEYCYSAIPRGGFVEEVTMDPYVFVDHGDKLLDLAPIMAITFTPRYHPDKDPKAAPSAVPEVMACPHLRRVYAIRFVSSRNRIWHTDRNDVEHVLASNHLDQLLQISLPRSEAGELQDDCWERAMERPEFRKMYWPGLPNYPGEGIHEYEDGWLRVREVQPMPARGRALEQKHGYLPSLHRANTWGTNEVSTPRDSEIALAHLRGELPKLPVGATVTDAVYDERPPPKRIQTGMP